MPNYRAFLAAAALLGLVMAGCASTLHPERVNQPVEKRGDLDLPLAIGNLAVPGGTLLLLYDFHTGAIYKPKPEPKPITWDKTVKTPPTPAPTPPPTPAPANP